jgi:hypothetical protein
MKSVVDRYIQLGLRAADTGLTRAESQELEGLRTSITSEDIRYIQTMRRQANESLEASQRDLRRLKYYREAVNSRGQVLKQCESNDRAIEDTHMDLAMFVEACKDDRFASQFAWIDPPLPRKQALAKDREEFEAFVNQNNFSDNEANFNAARELFGPGNITVAALAQAVRTNKLQLSPVLPQEAQEREEIRLDKEKLRLQNAQAHELRDEVRAGAAARKAQVQRDQIDYEFGLKQQQEATTAYPPLPPMLPEFLAKRYGNIKLDRAFLIKKADRDAFRYLHQRFGMTQIEQLLRGEI